MTKRIVHMLVTGLVIFSSTYMAFGSDLSEADRVLHFDQPHPPISSPYFQQQRELKPMPNDFRIVEASYLSNNIGERWALITFENSSSGQRVLKNESIVATFADGNQSRGYNLNEVIKGNERLTKSVFFGIHQFPIIKVEVD